VAYALTRHFELGEGLSIFDFYTCEKTKKLLCVTDLACTCTGAVPYPPFGAETVIKALYPRWYL